MPVKGNRVTTEIESLSPTKVSLTIEIHSDDVKEEREKVFQEMARGIQLKGFRKGKAPRKMVEKLVNQELLREELLKRLVGQAYDEAVKEKKIFPITPPEVEIVNFQESQPLKFKATFERRPEISLPDYKALNAKVKQREFKEEEVDKTLETLKQQKASYVDFEGGVLEEGRGAVVDLQGLIGGKPFEGGSWQGILLQMQRNWPVIPGLMEKMFGMKSGDEREIDVVLPENFDSEVAGKSASFKVRVHGVKERRLPELDDAFAQSMSQEFKTAEDLRNAVRSQIQSYHRHEERNEGLNQALNELSETLDFPVPEVFVEEKLKQFERETLQALQQRKKPFEEFLKEKYPEVFSIAGIREEDTVNRAVSRFREELRPQALKQAKIDLILDEISQKENLKVTQEEVNSEIGRLAQSFGMSSESITKALEDKGRLQAFLGGILRAKAALLLRESLKINY